MINELRFAWRAGCFRKLLIIAKHVYQSGFANIASTDKSIFWFIRFWRLLIIGAAYNIFG